MFCTWRMLQLGLQRRKAVGQQKLGQQRHQVLALHHARAGGVRSQPHHKRHGVVPQRNAHSGRKVVLLRRRLLAHGSGAIIVPAVIIVFACNGDVRVARAAVVHVCLQGHHFGLRPKLEQLGHQRGPAQRRQAMWRGRREAAQRSRRGPNRPFDWLRRRQAPNRVPST